MEISTLCNSVLIGKDRVLVDILSHKKGWFNGFGRTRQIQLPLHGTCKGSQGKGKNRGLLISAKYSCKFHIELWKPPAGFRCFKSVYEYCTNKLYNIRKQYCLEISSII